jgi:glucose/arabinose dehydrogenase
MNLKHTAHTAAPILATLLTLPFCGLARAQNVDAIWSNNCMKCHGENGEGGGAGTSSLLDDTYTWGGSNLELYNSIKDGHPDDGMEAFGATLKPSEIWSLVVHIREEQARAKRKQTGSPKADKQGQFKSQHHTYVVQTVAEESLDVPWAVDFVPAKVSGTTGLPAGSMLITNKPGSIVVMSSALPGAKKLGEITGLPAVRNEGQGGLMDITLHPEFASNGWIYLAFSDPEGGEGRRSLGMTKIVRGRVAKEGDDFAWKDQQTIFEAKKEHYTPGGLHFGSRVVFQRVEPALAKAGAPTHYVYWAIGERGRGDNAQDRKLPNGKIHRLFDDGTVPKDNPFVAETNAAAGEYASIWSYGHRNPQGLVFDLDGNLWDTEHGPRGGDEVNLILKGRNYGWPLVSFGINYNNSPLRTPWPASADRVEANATGAVPAGGTEDGSLVMPAFVWIPSIGACGLDVVRGPDANGGGGAFPKWRNDLVAGGLSGANVDRLRIRVEGGNAYVAEREELVHGMGRVRDVVVGPDGTIYVVLNGPDKVVRLAPG